MAHLAGITAADTFRTLDTAHRELAATDAETLRSQIDLARIAAPTGNEGARGRWVAARLGEAGFTTRFDDAGNVAARMSHASGAAPVTVCAHLDTVFPEGTALDVRRDGARVTGPGICDNARGLAAMLAIARIMPRCAPSFVRPVEFVATTGEEGAGDLRGARHHFANSAPPFAVIVLDGAGDDCIVNSALGARRFRIEYRGPGGHSWAAPGTVNPVHAAARAAANVANLRLPRGSASSLTVSRIGGGHSVNSIAELAWLEIDARSTSEPALALLEREVRDVVAAAARQENDQRTRASAQLTHRVDRIGIRPAGETPADSALVASAIEATRLVGCSPHLATASTDANAAIAIGVPAIAIGGGGRGGDTHTSHEWFENDRGAAGVQRALTIIATMARVATD